MKPSSFLPRDCLRMPIGIGLSLLLHAALLLLWSRQAPRPPDSVGSASRVPLVVELNRQALGQKTVPPPPAAAPSPPPSPAAPTPLRKPRPAAKKPPEARPTVPARAAASPRAPSATRPAPAAPVQENAAPPSDMSEMVAAARARRRAAGIPAPGEPSSSESARAEDDRAQGDAVARANIARSIAQARGRSGSGGIFHITHKGVRSAEFLFRGWDSGSRAGGRELVQVDAGPNGDVEQAIVRKMIEIIRKHQSGDFSWDSRRLGRVVSLSARREDGAGLEDFLKQEFFGSPR